MGRHINGLLHILRVVHNEMYPSDKQPTQQLHSCMDNSLHMPFRSLPRSARKDTLHIIFRKLFKKKKKKCNTVPKHSLEWSIITDAASPLHGLIPSFLLLAVPYRGGTLGCRNGRHGEQAFMSRACLLPVSSVKSIQCRCRSISTVACEQSAESIVS